MIFRPSLGFPCYAHLHFCTCNSNMPPAPTLTPFFPSHSLLPSLASFTSSLPPLNPAELKQWWLSSTTDPLHPALVFCAGLSGLVWILGEVTGELHLSPSGNERVQSPAFSDRRRNSDQAECKGAAGPRWCTGVVRTLYRIPLLLHGSADCP